MTEKKEPLNAWGRFRRFKRAYWSAAFLVLLYGLSLCAELIANDRPLYVRYQDKHFFPALKSYLPDAYANHSQRTFLPNGLLTRANYKTLMKTDSFKGKGKNYMIFPPIPYGPYESLDPADLHLVRQVHLEATPVVDRGYLQVRQNGSIRKSYALDAVFDQTSTAIKTKNIKELLMVGDALQQAIDKRFSNQADEKRAFTLTLKNKKTIDVVLSSYKARRRAPKSVRIKINEQRQQSQVYRSHSDGKQIVSDVPSQGTWWQALGQEQQRELQLSIQQRLRKPIAPLAISDGQGKKYLVKFNYEDIHFPLSPIMGHPLGIDGTGRDVLVRIFYGMRTSMTFGLLLVVASVVLGIIAGAIQGYCGGWVDILAQRLIEIWESMPFLYIMILMGAIYGRGFLLLLFCYGIFNWIGISYYMRAEFLRLRRQGFVEAARCLGAGPLRLIFVHMLPNALVPIITFFPFLLVGAIGSLTALDYLGFGLPEPTPSWGELLSQAQEAKWAWWLIVYPSLALFVVMLLGVFVGEGARAAFDPKRLIRWR